MQFSESWLRSFVDPALDSEALAHTLTMAGLEIESLRPVAPPLHGVVVGQVLEVSRHPNADRLNVCSVDAGTGTPLTIVCGAPNVAPGIKVPCALVGARLPAAQPGGEPFEIRLSKLRGVESAGMLCSARELQVSGEDAGLLILSSDASVGAPIGEVLDLNDHIFEVKLTPNRADCLSVLGIARETAALTGAPLRAPVFTATPVTLDEVLPVKVLNDDLCGRFSGRVVRGVDARATTPAWMVRRLERAGQRSISALVDISNYLMLELGRPTHVFDLDKISGPVEVRWARDGESLKLLNGNTVELDATVGVIAAANGVESLAGIMGGDSTAVTLDTRNIYLEAAFWWPDSIRGRSRRFNFSTDAGHRFERGVDYSTTVEHLERLTQLILEICGGQAGPVDDHILRLPERNPVTMRVARAARVIGVPLQSADVASVFERLGFVFMQRDEVFSVTPPSYRFDLEIEEDLIEEVARIRGYEAIPAQPPLLRSAMRGTQETLRPVHALRHRLAERGYSETVNFSFVDAEWERDFSGNATPLTLLNPIASQLAVMRTSLIGSLVGVLRHNTNRKVERARIFEVGRVFRADAGVAGSDATVLGIAQPLMIGALAYGSVFEAQWGEKARRVDFFDVKADVEALLAPRIARFVAAEHPALHPGRCARVELDGQVVGWLGELHPRWLQKYELPQAPIVFELEAQAIATQALPVVAEVPKFPPVTRDLALVVKQDVAVQALLDELEAARAEPACAMVRRIALFDEFRPAAGVSGGLASGEKSLAFRITLQDTGGTLQDETVDLAVAQLVQRLARVYGARLRGEG
ncbi:MAG: phenylalanine--tRNA ligase subunit beta [Janthinobacterium lividum]